jgi:imidazolonepropionase-like amidohydrolase
MASLAISAPMAWLGPRRIVADVVVVCRGGVIERVTIGEAPPSEIELLATNGFLVPAGADRHVHVELSDPVAMVRRGVTAVRDLAWPADRIFPLAEASEAPGFEGPFIRAVGPMVTAPGGYPSRARWAPTGTAEEVADPEAATATVDGLIERGAAAIKVSMNADEGPTPSDAVLSALCDAAHAHDVPVTAHAQGEGQVARALGAGVDELAHTPWSERLSDDLVAASATRMRWVTTLDIHGFGTGSAELDVALENLARFHRAGGEVAYGTDLGNGSIPPGIHTRELRLIREAGLATEEVLEVLTRAPVEPGAPADLVVLADSPLGDLEAFDDQRLVVKAGRVVLARD